MRQEKTVWDVDDEKAKIGNECVTVLRTYMYVKQITGRSHTQRAKPVITGQDLLVWA